MQGQVFRVLKCSIEEDDLLVQNISIIKLSRKVYLKTYNEYFKANIFIQKVIVNKVCL